MKSSWGTPSPSICALELGKLSCLPADDRAKKSRIGKTEQNGQIRSSKTNGIILRKEQSIPQRKYWANLFITGKVVYINS